MGNSPKEMLAFVDSKLKGRTVGYAIAIYHGKDLVLSTSGGSAVLKPQTKMTSLTRTLVGSMSKTITAAAVVPRLYLSGHGLTVDSAIEPYLPASWHKGPNVDQITFRMLLTHTSGLPNKGWGFDDLKTYIAEGVHDILPAPSVYSNSGYCLFRVIVPYLWSSKSFMNKTEGNPQVDFPKFLGDTYVEHVRSTVFENAGITGADVVPTGTKPYTLYYNFQNPNKTWQVPSDNRLYAGAGGWILSAREYGRFLVELQYGQLSHFWEIMRDTPAPSVFTPEPTTGATPRLGMWRFPGKEGNYFGHNGEQGFFNPADPAQNVTGFGGWMVYPNGTTAVLLANSNHWFSEEQEWNILLPAYDN